MEDNRLIAEFMGLDSQILSTNNIHSWNDAPFYYITEDSKEKVMEGISKYSKYHTSWDWLMPVVDKCYQNGELHNSYREQVVASLSGVIDIEDTYNSVVDFIKHQNDKKL